MVLPSTIRYQPPSGFARTDGFHKGVVAFGDRRACGIAGRAGINQIARWCGFGLGCGTTSSDAVRIRVLKWKVKEHKRVKEILFCHRPFAREFDQRLSC